VPSARKNTTGAKGVKTFAWCQSRESMHRPGQIIFDFAPGWNLKSSF